jgi:cyclopropane-fatty-acyl-phospholipid synthase
MSDTMDKEIRLTTDGSGRLVEGKANQPNAFDRWLVRSVGRLVGAPRVRFLLWNGEAAYEPDSAAIGTLRFGSRATLLKICTSPENVFAESYVDGSIVLEGDPVEVLMELSASNRLAMPRDSLRRRIIHLLRPPASTSLRKAKQNIHSHYDLGNDFYARWLDSEMVYTCAYYPRADATLEQAQIAKMDHVCRKLELKPGQSVIETGCGWGSLARHMARHYGVNVTAYNISHEQIVYANERTRAEGLDDRVTFVEDDYRNATGEYDAFVSIGMLEHVGLNNFPALGATIDRTMKEGGRGLIHSIGRSWSEPVNAWIERNIFPGGAVPSLREMMDVFEPAGMSVLDVENLRLHYAQTCREWLDRFESMADAAADQFGEDFVRAWRLYLAGSSAAFLIGNLQLFQVVIARADDNTVPLTREYMYPGAYADDEATSRFG